MQDLADLDVGTNVGLGFGGPVSAGGRADKGAEEHRALGERAEVQAGTPSPPGAQCWLEDVACVLQAAESQAKREGE